MTIDVHSDTWREIREWAEGRLIVHGATLRTRGLPSDDAEAARAVMDELETLLKLPNPSTIPSQIPYEEP